MAAARDALYLNAKEFYRFGDDVELAPNLLYNNVVRGTKKFAIVQISSAGRLDIGIKRKGVKPSKRFEASGTWNPMVTHRVRIMDAKQIDKEVMTWLKEACQDVK